MGEDDEKRIFRELMGDVNPLPDDERVHHRPPPPRPVAKFTQADRDAVVDALTSVDPGTHIEDTGDGLLFRGRGLDRATFRRLRRGQMPLDAELDLHGETARSAPERIADFLLRARDDGARCVRIIHGKGRRSGGRGPVLREVLDACLRRREDVIAYVTTRPEDGGTGAVYVLLRRRA